MTQLHVARADYWDAAAQLRGCGRAEVGGARLVRHLSRSGPWNGASIGPGSIDVEAIRAWFDGEAWAATVPAGQDWAYGRELRRQPLMGVPIDQVRCAPSAPEVMVRTATLDDLAIVAEIDGVAFGVPSDPTAQNVDDHRAHLSSSAAHVALAWLGDTPVATAYTVTSHGYAGPAILLGGVGVRPEARRRGIAAALSTWLLTRPGQQGLAHLSSETDEAARVYERLGFRLGGESVIYVDC